MGFCELNMNAEYRSLRDNIVVDFYIPVLKRSVLYKRAVGFFSSSALIEISRGITGLVKNGGKIRLIASPRLEQDDVEAIARGYQERRCVIEKAVMAAITEPLNHFEEERLNLLAHLISDGHLDIKIAFTESASGIGMYHEKMGILYDTHDNLIAFSGSMNETFTALTQNYETIDVFRSWTPENTRVRAKEVAFDALWSNSEPSIRVVEFPKVAIDRLCMYKKTHVDLQIDEKEYAIIKTPSPFSIGPHIPEGVHLHDYQQEAINEWARHGFRGIFDMATGTGKTYTGLGAIATLYHHLGGRLAVLIVCPLQHLVEQWVADTIHFGMRPIIGYSASRQRNWKMRLKDAVIDFNLGIREHFCFVTTNATFASEFVAEQISRLIGNVLLVVDEAHNFGSSNLSTTLNPEIPYRLALSATIERHGDEEGTERLFSYFGEKCIEYTLQRAIREGKLTPYYYHPVVVHLDDEELAEYRSVTKKMAKHCSSDARGNVKIDDYGKLLLIKRARIVAGARDKLDKLEELMLNFKNETHMLVYCGATTIGDPGYEEGVADDFEMRQIDAVSDLLGNKLGMRISQFTSVETSDKREILKSEFAEGTHIQTLVAIRCLDEGVNIPSIKTAFILASSTNPKEYIQRRGRVLRKFPGKHHAVIYDFITLPRPLERVGVVTIDEIKMDVPMIRREITRMRDFAAIAENPAETDCLIYEIEETYGLTKIGGDL
jgi:superfamily II DNA or RNA helicase